MLRHVYPGAGADTNKPSPTPKAFFLKAQGWRAPARLPWVDAHHPLPTPKAFFLEAQGWRAPARLPWYVGPEPNYPEAGSGNEIERIHGSN